ncbi:MAG: signal recognition particle-docking protein FtsY [Phycisphaerales bacterium]|nr:signal recognition particle-docking protein FtsY [Phycisphaerales bacterium]
MIFKSAIDAVRRGLARTASAVGLGLRSILHGRRLDESLINEVESQLIAADVGVIAAREIVDSLRCEFRAGRVERGEDALEHLKRRMKERLAPRAGMTLELATSSTKPAVVLVVGVNGVGKTTSVAKIAQSIRASGKTVLLAAADTYRAGAVAQLSVWAERLGVDIIRGSAGGDPAAVAFDGAEAAVARGVDVLLVDTAGRLHNEASLMRQLVKIRDVLRKRIPGAPHETLLVLDATSGQNAIAQARAFQSAVDISGIFLAKMDGTARGGVVIAIHDALGVPVKLIGVGETPQDVQPFDADRFVDAVFSAQFVGENSGQFSGPGSTISA